jgi:hypothetical protein
MCGCLVLVLVLRPRFCGEFRGRGRGTRTRTRREPNFQTRSDGQSGEGAAHEEGPTVVTLLAMEGELRVSLRSPGSPCSLIHIRRHYPLTVEVGHYLTFSPLTPALPMNLPAGTGRDAFHCVPNCRLEDGDAVERVPTGFRGSIRELVRGILFPLRGEGEAAARDRAARGLLSKPAAHSTGRQSRWLWLRRNSRPPARAGCA